MCHNLIASLCYFAKNTQPNQAHWLIKIYVYSRSKEEKKKRENIFNDLLFGCIMKRAFYHHQIFDKLYIYIFNIFIKKINFSPLSYSKQVTCTIFNFTPRKYNLKLLLLIYSAISIRIEQLAQFFCWRFFAIINKRKSLNKFSVIFLQLFFLFFCFFLF